MNGASWCPHQGRQENGGHAEAELHISADRTDPQLRQLQTFLLVEDVCVVVNSGSDTLTPTEAFSRLRGGCVAYVASDAARLFLRDHSQLGWCGTGGVSVEGAAVIVASDHHVVGAEELEHLCRIGVDRRVCWLVRVVERLALD